MDQTAVDHELNAMKTAFLQAAAKEKADFEEAASRLQVSQKGKAAALASAAANRSEAAIADEKIRALLEESGGRLSHEVKNLKKKKREYLIAADDDDETAREIQHIIDRHTIDASDKGKLMVQRRYQFLSRMFKQMIFEEATRLSKKLHAMMLIEAKRRHTDNGYNEMAAIHGGDFRWVEADLLQEIRQALADENLEPEPLSDEVKVVLELTDIGDFVPLSMMQRKILLGLNGSASAV